MLIANARKITLITLPLLVTKVSLPIRGFIITWILSQLGVDDMAAGGLVFSLMMVFATFLLGAIMSSVGVSIAYAVGDNNNQEVEKILQQGLWLGILLSIIPTVIFYNLTYILLLLGQNSVVINKAISIGYGITWLFIPYSICAALYKLFVNLESSRVPMFYGLLSLITAVLLSYILALGSFGFSGLGITGVGIGMAVAYWLQALGMFIHLRVCKKYSVYKIFTRQFVPNIDYLKRLWRIGWPVGLKYNIEGLLFFVIAAILGVSNHIQLAVFQVILQFFMLSSCLSSAVGIAGETLLGQAIGSNKRREIIPISIATIIIALFSVSVISLFLYIYPHFIVTFFKVDSLGYTVLANAMICVICFQLLDGLRTVLSDILVTFKQSILPLIIETTSLWIIGLPTGYWLYNLSSQGLNSMLNGLVLGSLCSVILLLIYTHSTIRDHLQSDH